MSPVSRLLPVLIAIALASGGCGHGPSAPGPSAVEDETASSAEPIADAGIEPRTAGAIADADAGAGPTEAPLPGLVIESPLWFDLAAATADRETLAPGLARHGYELPEGSYVLAARIVDGVDQPAFAYLSRGDDGFVDSDGNFWPASSIKLIAAIGALVTLRGYGLTGDARLDFEDHKGRWNKKAERLYCNALTWSSNLAYDRLIRVAGFDEINRDFLTEERGFRYGAFQCSYASGKDGPSLRESPEIKYSEGDKQGVIPARSGTYDVQRCSGGNCFSLFELLDPLSRVVMRDELPAAARFDVAPIDIRRLKAFLTQSKCGFADSAAQVFGDETRIYNKRGYSPSMDMIDHALIVDQKTGRRYLLAASVRFVDRDKERAKAELAELGTHALSVLARFKPQGVLLQRDAGVAIEFAAEAVSEREMAITVDAAADAGIDRLELYRGHELVGSSDGARVEARLSLKGAPDIFIVQAYSGGKLVGYRAVQISRR